MLGDAISPLSHMGSEAREARQNMAILESVFKEQIKCDPDLPFNERRRRGPGACPLKARVTHER